MKLTTYSLFTLFIFFLSSTIQAEVSRSSFTTNIQDREPIDQLYALTDNLKEVFYFTELKDLQGQTITHQWSNAGKASHSITFDVGANRWRVYSSKTLNKPEGTWTVTVSDANGLILKEESISYGNAGAVENTTPENDSNQKQEENAPKKTTESTPEKQTEETSNPPADTPEKETANQVDSSTDETTATNTENATTDKKGNLTREEDGKTDNNKPVWDKL